MPDREALAVQAWLSTFYPFQREWVLDTSRFAAALKARQIGASHSYGASGTLWSLLGEQTVVVSIGEREAAEVLEKVRRHATALSALGSSWATMGPRNAREVRFPKTGGRVIALPSTSGGRGYSGNVILDEFAYHERPEDVWDGAGGAVMHGYRMRVLSTPNGVGNLFHDLCTNPRTNAGYRIHSTTIDEAVAQGFPVDMDACWKMARGDARVFDQMFRCAFLDNEAQYLPTDLVNSAVTDEEPPREGDVFAGLDVGRTADRTELILVRVVDGIHWAVHRESRKRTSYEDLEQLAALAIQTYGARRLCIDSTGLGSFPAEMLQKRFGRSRVEPVPFTMQLKEDLATTLYQRLVDGELRLRRDDAQVRDDLCAIRRIVTHAGNIRYDAPHTDQGHADSAWALALALHACSRPSGRRHVLDDYGDDYEA